MSMQHLACQVPDDLADYITDRHRIKGRAVAVALARYRAMLAALKVPLRDQFSRRDLEALAVIFTPGRLAAEDQGALAAELCEATGAALSPAECVAMLDALTIFHRNRWHGLAAWDVWS